MSSNSYLIKDVVLWFLPCSLFCISYLVFFVVFEQSFLPSWGLQPFLAPPEARHEDQKAPAAMPAAKAAHDLLACCN